MRYNSQLRVAACFHVFSELASNTFFPDIFLLVTGIYLKPHKIEASQLISSPQKYRILLRMNLPVSNHFLWPLHLQSFFQFPGVESVPHFHSIAPLFCSTASSFVETQTQHVLASHLVLRGT